MAKIHLMGAALVAAAVVAGCCDKEQCTAATPAQPEAAAPAATPAVQEAEAATEPPKDPNEVVMQVGEAKLGIVNAIGNATQGFISGLTSYIQAGAKEGEAQQEKAREELEQTKDLFNQAQELVDAVVQLMQAVTSAETQSMRDAIQA